MPDLVGRPTGPTGDGPHDGGISERDEGTMTAMAGHLRDDPGEMKLLAFVPRPLAGSQGRAIFLIDRACPQHQPKPTCFG